MLGGFCRGRLLAGLFGAGAAQRGVIWNRGPSIEQWGTALPPLGAPKTLLLPLCNVQEPNALRERRGASSSEAGGAFFIEVCSSERGGRAREVLKGCEGWWGGPLAADPGEAPLGQPVAARSPVKRNPYSSVFEYLYSSLL